MEKKKVSFKNYSFQKVFLFLIILFLGIKTSNAQSSRLKDKFFFGGALGLTVGTITQFDFVPVAGMWVIPQWALGVGGRYSYYSQRGGSLISGSQSYKAHIWGASGFTQILPIPDLSEKTPIPIRGGIFFHAEYEGLYLDRRMANPLDVNQQGKVWAELYLLGVGYRQRLGEKAALNVMLLWEIYENVYSPYPQNPMLRVYFTL